MMKQRAEILGAPLVPISGVVSARGRVTYYMHKGYDSPLADIELGPEEFGTSGTYIVAGDLNSPLNVWPVYAAVRLAA